MLLPYATDRPPKNPPLVVVALVLLNFVLFGIVALTLLKRDASSLVVMYANLSLTPSSLRWWAPITYAFLHEDVFHLSANMLFLWVFGASVEDALEWKRFLAFFFGAAIVTGMLQVLMTRIAPGADPTLPIIGASGAVSAIVGVFAVRFYRSRIRFIGLPIQVPALLLVALALASEMGAAIYKLVAQGNASQAVAHWSHIGGFVLGLAVAQLTKQYSAGRQEYMAVDARAAMEKGAPMSAVRRWEAILVTQPDDPDVHLELGRAWLGCGDRDQAISHFRNAIDRLLQAEKKNEAAGAYVELTRIDPKQALESAKHFAVAAALEELGDFRHAAAAFVLLVNQHPEAPETERALLRLGGIYLQRLDSPKEAAGVLAQFLERYPQSDWKSYAEAQHKIATERSTANGAK
jgi:membrane associated rhomboid family serine protease